MKPIIAIPQTGNDLFRKYMKSKYTYSLTRAGAKVRWIELQELDEAIKELLGCDGLLMAGGPDISPALYGQTPEKMCGTPNNLRDAAEPPLLKEFLKTRKPVLCICRGMQMLNVCQGGSLLQDISSIEKCNHSDFHNRARSTHSVTLNRDSRLYEILGENELTVNSIHHQVVDRVGDGLTVSAISSDGFIEALEMPEYPFCLGVQWHPEHMSRRSETQQRLFTAFVKATEGE